MRSSGTVSRDPTAPILSSLAGCTVAHDVTRSARSARRSVPGGSPFVRGRSDRRRLGAGRCSDEIETVEIDSEVSLKARRSGSARGRTHRSRGPKGLQSLAARESSWSRTPSRGPSLVLRTCRAPITAENCALVYVLRRGDGPVQSHSTARMVEDFPDWCYGASTDSRPAERIHRGSLPRRGSFTGALVFTPDHGRSGSPSRLPCSGPRTTRLRRVVTDAEGRENRQEP